jgi:hypothetical protein
MGMLASMVAPARPLPMV